MTVARVALVIFVAISIQTTLVARFAIGDVRGDVVLLIAIAAGLESDGERGAIVGFAAGLTFDLLLNTPVGLSALTCCLVGYLVGSFQRSVLRTTWWIPVLTTMVASALGVVLFAVLDQMIGRATVEMATVPGIVLAVSVLNGLLCRPFRWALRWALAASPTPRERSLLR